MLDEFKNVLFFSNLKIPLKKSISGGVETIFKRLSSDFQIVASSDSEIENAYKIPYHSRVRHLEISTDRSHVIKYYKELDVALREYFSSNNFDHIEHVILNHDSSRFLNTICEMLPGRKYYLWVHNNVYDRMSFIYLSELSRIVNERGDIKVIGCSEYNRRDLEASNLFKFHGVLPPMLFKKDEFKDVFNPNGNGKMIMTCRIAKDRKLDQVFKMMRECPNQQLDIYGHMYQSEDNIKYHEELFKTMPDNVKYLGGLEHSQLLNTVSEYSALLNIPFEAFGMSAYEAARLGLSIVYLKYPQGDGFDEYCSDQNRITIDTISKDRNKWKKLAEELSRHDLEAIDKVANYEFASQFNYELFKQRLRDLLQ